MPTPCISFRKSKGNGRSHHQHSRVRALGGDGKPSEWASLQGEDLNFLRLRSGAMGRSPAGARHFRVADLPTFKDLRFAKVSGNWVEFASGGEGHAQTPCIVMKVSHELELKLTLQRGSIPELARIPRLLGKDIAEAPRTEELETLYFDTAKGKLRETGVSLLIRRNVHRS